MEPYLRRIVLAMADTRKGYKDRVYSKIGGAFFEWLKAEAGSANHKTKWVTHWRNEAKRLIQKELPVALLHPIRGFKNRRKAAVEMLEYVESMLDSYLRASHNTAERDYKTPLKTKVSVDHAKTFFTEVQKQIDDTLGEEWLTMK